MNLPLNRERFWIEVTDIEDGRISGTVAGHLTMPDNDDLLFGTRIECETRHVFDTDPLKDISGNWRSGDRAPIGMMAGPPNSPESPH